MGRKVACRLLFSFLVVATMLGAGASLPAVATAQRLCENSDSSVANISPCTGPTGTTISVTLQRKLTSPPATLLFKRVLANGVPAQVKTSISGLTTTTPPQLCTQGGGRWEAWLIDAGGKSQGFIGAFWPDCTGTGAIGGSGAGGVGPSSGTASGTSQRLCENSDSAVASISPCTGPAGTKINVALRRKLSSPPKTLLFKRVLANGVPAQVTANISGLTALTTAQLCTTGGGKWEVWLVDSSGASQGLIGVFWPQCGAIDSCLVGTWRSESVALLGREQGGAGIVLTIKADGTESVDYNGMKPLKSGAGEINSWAGTASGRITASNGAAKVNSVDQSNLTHKLIDPNGKTSTNSMGRTLGPGAVGVDPKGAYACDENALTFKTTVQTFKFKREKKEP